jgi:hypothetical protein
MFGKPEVIIRCNNSHGTGSMEPIPVKAKPQPISTLLAHPTDQRKLIKYPIVGIKSMATVEP